MTYTVLALDRDRSAIGVATASCALAVGAAVPSLDPRVGAVASQAWTNELLRGRVLGALRGGDSPAAALSRLDSWEAEVELRQVGVLGVDGRGAAFTGRATTAWRGHEIDDGVVALGNVLTGPEVLGAMRGALAFEDSVAPAGATELAAALAGALAAGEAAGGDSRVGRARRCSWAPWVRTCWSSTCAWTTPRTGWVSSAGWWSCGPGVIAQRQ